ncbi:hypothetical protein [Pseudomonas sp. R45(2017)]|uniref:nSTAND3 domain-containing NTPase n=1 Tax=Pseudomonas sp. R45(2017) TaxID=1981678 RepID=UPI00111C22F1|nr:hypothetical protein [Pseudomonas sp. R45(2017)]
MSIATVGPKKYDFQDLVCVDIFLRYYNFEKAELYIEPEASEDAKVILPFLSGKEVIEVQVKGSQADLTLTELATWLAHFEERKSSNMLIERLCAKQDVSVVFVASARCNDNVSKFCKGAMASWDPHVKKLSREVARDLLSELKNHAELLESSESSLDKERGQHLKKFVKNAKIDKVRNDLARLIILENVLNDGLRDSCENRLRKLRVPADRFEILINRLTAIIKNAKDNKGDCYPALFAELNKNLPEITRPQNYIFRGNEESWKSELSENNILLLSGSPRVGKTNAGRWVAAEFEELGYQLKLSSNLEEIERFLLDTTPGERLAVLDDPLGGVLLTNDPVRTLSKIQQLSRQLSPSRKLVVSQVQDRLLQVTGAARLENTKLGTFVWHDLGLYDCDFLAEVWRVFHHQFSIPNPLFDNILASLLDGTLHIEPGCLMHLAASHYRLFDPSDIDEAIRLAREDSQSLAFALLSEGLGPILQALAIATSHDDACSLQDLTYVLGGDGTENRYAVASYLGVSLSFGAQRELPERETENYHDLSLSSENKDLLEILERRRIIVETGVDRFNFSHQFYRSAAEQSANGSTSSSAKRLLTQTERSLFSLSFESSRAAAVAMRWIYQVLITPDRRELLIDLAIDGLDSRYLITKDACFSFLLNTIEDISEGKRSDFKKWVSKVSFLSLSHVLWERGQATLPAGDNNTIEGRFFESYEWEEIENFFTAFSVGSSSTVSAEDAWKTVCYLESHPNRLSKPVLLRFLGYDLGSLRAKAAKIWINQVRDNDKEVLGRIFSDQHPAVAQEVLEGVLRAWQKCDKVRKDDLLDGLRKYASLPASASTMIAIMLKMDHQARGRELHWDLFGGLLPNLLATLPEGANLNDARLYGAVEKSLDHIPLVDFIGIIDSWIGLLEREALRVIPSDYAMAVTELLIRGTITTPKSRVSRLERLFKINGTGAQIRVVVELINNWDLLTTADQQMVLTHLGESRYDQYWLHAAAVTRNLVPQDVIDLMSHSKEMSLVGSLQNFDSKTLEYALKIYMGNPGILWHLGLHHQGSEIWEPIIESIALKPEHNLFRKAWEHITLASNDTRISDFVAKLADNHPQEIFERLLEHKIKTNGGFMPGAWGILLDHAPNELLDGWFLIMASHAQRVLDNLFEVPRWVGKKYEERLFKFFHDDICLMNSAFHTNKKLTEVFSKFEDVDIFELRTKIANSELHNFMADFRCNPPVHFSTCDSIQNMFKEIGCTDADLQEVEDHRLALLKLGYEYDSGDAGEKLQHWIY